MIELRHTPKYVTMTVAGFSTRATSPLGNYGIFMDLKV